MAAIGLTLLFLLPPIYFAAAAALLLLGAGGREAGRLGGLPEPWQWLVFAGLLLVLAAVLYGSLNPTQRPVALFGVIVGGWLCMLCWLIAPSFGRKLRGLKLVALALVLLGAWSSLVLLQSQTPWLVLLVVAIIAAADIGAYFAGHAIGGAKLAPRISPGKTWAGAIGGLAAATLLSSLVAVTIPEAPFVLPVAAAIGLVLAVVSIGGDLFISLLKRQQGLKDSSSLLPGHGGLLDRFDSLGAALPFFAIAWLIGGQ
jgi:phosphatidate cytidylyltransferase